MAAGTQEKEKMREFVGKLWQNPTMVQTPITKKESQILQFLRENQSQVQKIFGSSDYFPHLSWDEAVRLLLTEMLDKLFETMAPKFDRIKENILHPSLLNALGAPAEIEEERFKEFLLKLIKVKYLRDPMLLSIEAISFELFDKYIPELIARRKTVYTELVRRDRLNLETPLLTAYFHFCLLLRPLFFYKIPSRPGATDLVSMHEAAKDQRKLDAMVNILRSQLIEEIGSIPESLIRPAVESFLNVNDFPETTGASRLIAIMMARSAAYDPNQKTDRGAESPDKSWFNITRRNAKHYGFDSRMLEELYQLAGDKGW